MPTEHTRGAAASPAEVTLDVSLGRIVSASPRPEEPFRIAVLGNFRGRGAQGTEATPALAHRRPVAVDRDNFDDALAHFAPELRISLSEPGPEISIRFRELDDFHPDRLYERLPLFQSLRETRQRLANPATFREAARELWGTAEPPAAAPVPENVTPPAASGSLLDQILGEPPGPAAAPPARQDDLADYIRRIVAPHQIPDADPRQPDALAQLDAAISSQMRMLLHHPDFQALEALWRSVFLLVRRVETDTQLQLHLVDVTRAELAADLAPERELQQTAMYRLLIETSAQTLGDMPWALLIGNFTFGSRPEDLRHLRRIGKLAQLAGGPWIAGADPRLVGCPSFDSAPDPDDWMLPPSAEWDELRRAPEAANIGLALPRFLLRLPYGEDSDACERFRFEELEARPDHESYLWGNAAIVCGLLIAQAFASDGWKLRPGTHREIGGLPLHLIRDDGSVTAKPCAEALMTERAAARILEAGVMPLASLKDQDAVLLVRFQSVASPSAALAGRWTLTGRG